MRTVLARALLVIAGLATGCLLLEATLWMAGYRAPGTANFTKLGRDREFDPLPGIRYLYHAYAPYSQSWPDNPRGYFDADHSLVYRVNNYGFRGDDLVIDRNERIRIAFVGDSFCWGSGVRLEDRFTSIIEKRLNRERILGQAYEVYNFCLPGFNTVNEVSLYEQVIVHFQPDLLVVTFFLNDVNLPPDLFVRWRSWVPRYFHQWRKRSRLVDFLVHHVGGMVAQREFEASVNRAYEPGHRGYESVAEQLARLAELNRRREVATVLAVFPWLIDLEEDSYPFHGPHLALRRLGEKMGFKVIELFHAFEGKKAEELWVHPIDQHPNEIGHRIAANSIYSGLEEVLRSSGPGLLERASRRRSRPVPSDLRTPGRQWYKAFAATDAPTSGGDEGGQEEFPHHGDAAGEPNG